MLLNSLKYTCNLIQPYMLQHKSEDTERQISWCQLEFDSILSLAAFLSSYLWALRHSVISFHSHQPVFSPCRQRSCAEAVRAQRVLVPPPPGSAAPLSGQGLNTSRYCWWSYVESCCNVKALCQHSTVHHRYVLLEGQVASVRGLPPSAVTHSSLSANVILNLPGRSQSCLICLVKTQQFGSKLTNCKCKCFRKQQFTS